MHEDKVVAGRKNPGVVKSLGDERAMPKKKEGVRTYAV
jgi:hypothetical protein